MLNSVISTENGRFMTGDWKDFYQRPRRVRVRTHPCTSHPRPHNRPIQPQRQNRQWLCLCGSPHGHVWARPQAGKLANDRLAKFLDPLGQVCPLRTHPWTLAGHQ
jgi:hypothetical protein